MSRSTLVCLLAAALAAWLAGSASAVYQVTSLSSPASNWGWQTHSARCWNGKGGILSWYNPGARGNAGPAPCANLGFELPEGGSTGGADQPPQSWTGTNRYVGVKLSDIKKISYWAILDWAGPARTPLLDNNGCDVYATCWDPRPEGWPCHWKEYRLQSQSSQPPHVLLIITINGGVDYRTVLFRPWSSTLLGFGPSAVEFKATGTARLHRIWQQYTPVDVENGIYDGVWYVTEAVNEAHPTGMYTWEELLATYTDATLATPTVVQNPVFNSDPAQAPIPCSFNLHLGALAHSNSDWTSVGKNVWWFESYWARGAADLVTFAYDADPGEGETIIEETFDFDVLTRESTNIPFYNPPDKVRALSNLAVFDQTVYMPDPRTRPMLNPSERSEPWAGGSVNNANMNAVQRYGHFGTSTLYSPGVSWAHRVPGSTTGNLYALYGLIVDEPVPAANSGYWFNVDDGAGKKIKCYCPQAIYEGKIQQGNYVRLVGSLQGNNPYEWYWNWFHIVQFRSTYPFNCPTSQPWPWEFQTYPWAVTVLNP